MWTTLRLKKMHTRRNNSHVDKPLLMYQSLLCARTKFQAFFVPSYSYLCVLWYSVHVKPCCTNSILISFWLEKNWKGKKRSSGSSSDTVWLQKLDWIQCSQRHFHYKTDEEMFNNDSYRHKVNTLPTNKGAFHSDGCDGVVMGSGGGVVLVSSSADVPCMKSVLTSRGGKDVC